MSYAPVSQFEAVELGSHSTNSNVDTESASSSSSTQAPLTKRSIYSSHRIEARTPRFEGEDDAAYKRRITSQHLNAIIHSLGWVIAAGAVLYFTDLWNIVRYDVRVNR